jgi:hypothetical protein
MPTELPALAWFGTRRFTYWREIVAVLCLKIVGLSLLYFLFFAPADQTTLTQRDVARHLVGNSMAGMADR